MQLAISVHLCVKTVNIKELLLLVNSATRATLIRTGLVSFPLIASNQISRLVNYVIMGTNWFQANALSAFTCQLE